MSDDPHHHQAAAAGWVVHLRSGGTTPWTEWSRDVGRPPVAAPPGEPPGELPGAAHLELLRRLNALGPQPARADHVLHRPPPGRGAVELRLPWPPARPAAEHELLRVAVGVLADLVAVLPEPDAPTVRRSPGLPSLRRGPAWLLEGPPWTAAGLRTALATSGRPADGRRRRWPWGRHDPELVVLVVAPAAEGLHEVWSRRAEQGRVGTWLRFLDARVARDRLPPALEIGAVARRWAASVGPGAVHVVPLCVAGEVIEELVGVRLPDDQLVVPLLPSHTELARRVSNVLPFVVPEEELLRRRASFAVHLREDAAAWDPSLGPRRLALPEEVEPWLADVADRLADEVQAVGCRVHGDLRDVLLDRTGPEWPDPSAGADRALTVRQEHIVAAAVRMIHRVGRVVDGAAGRQG